MQKFLIPMNTDDDQSRRQAKKCHWCISNCNTALYKHKLYPHFNRSSSQGWSLSNSGHQYDPNALKYIWSRTNCMFKMQPNATQKMIFYSFYLYSYLFMILLGFHYFWKADLNNDLSTRNILLKYSFHN